MADTQPGGGFWSRTCRALFSPSARWSVFTLLVAGIVIGAVGILVVDAAVHATGTNAFCGGACHSMQWVAKEHAESAHGANRTGVHAGCHDCHIPRNYPELLWVKAKAGTKDIIGELRGVIGTQEKFEKERPRMAQEVWDEYKANGSRACRSCHEFTPETLKKQKEFAQPMHQQVLEGKATCIDCHKGVGHKAPG